MEFKNEVEQLKTEYKKVTDSLKDQFENSLKLKNEELERYTLKTQEYQAKQKDQIRGMESELEKLNNMFQKQEQTIERVENGGYSSGLKSFFIPTKDKCVLPTRQKFPCLYKILDTKKTEVTTKTLYRDKEKEIKETQEPKETKAATQEDFAKKTSAPLLASKSQVKFTTTFGNIAHTGVSALSKVSEKPDNQEIDFGVNIDKITDKDLIRYATNFQKLCRKMKDTEKELKSQAEKFAELNAYGDIYEVIRERDRYKELYREETKKTNENKVKFETQKRMLKSSPSAGSTQTKFRPGTAGWH